MLIVLVKRSIMFEVASKGRRRVCAGSKIVLKSSKCMDQHIQTLIFHTLLLLLF